MVPSEMNDGRLIEMMGGFGMGFGGIFWIVLLALVIWTVTSLAMSFCQAFADSLIM